MNDQSQGLLYVPRYPGHIDGGATFSFKQSGGGGAGGGPVGVPAEFTEDFTNPAGATGGSHAVSVLTDFTVVAARTMQEAQFSPSSDYIIQTGSYYKASSYVWTGPGTTIGDITSYLLKFNGSQYSSAASYCAMTAMVHFTPCGATEDYWGDSYGYAFNLNGKNHSSNPLSIVKYGSGGGSGAQETLVNTSDKTWFDDTATSRWWLECVFDSTTGKLTENIWKSTNDVFNNASIVKSINATDDGTLVTTGKFGVGFYLSSGGPPVVNSLYADYHIPES